MSTFRMAPTQSYSALNNLIMTASSIKDLQLVLKYFSHHSGCSVTLDKNLIENFQRILNTILLPSIVDTEHFEGMSCILLCLDQQSIHNDDALSWEEVSLEFTQLVNNCLKYIILFLDTEENMFISLWSLLSNIIINTSTKCQNIKNTMVKELSTTLIDIICNCKISHVQQKETLKALITVLSSSDRVLRRNILKNFGSELSRLISLLKICGDYDTQVCIIEVILRYTTQNGDRSQLCKLIGSDTQTLQLFNDIKFLEFDTGCRNFLYHVNSSLGKNARVFSIPCSAVYLGNHQITKPKDNKYDKFWVDFNLGSETLNVICDRLSLVQEEVTEPYDNHSWEVITIDTSIVRKVTLKVRLHSEESTNCKELKLYLKSPCKFIYESSEPCAGSARDMCIILPYPTASMEMIEIIILPTMFKKKYQDTNSSIHNVKVSHSSAILQLSTIDDNLLSGSTENVQNSSTDHTVQPATNADCRKRKASCSSAVCKINRKMFTPLECVVSRSPRNYTSQDGVVNKLEKDHLQPPKTNEEQKTTVVERTTRKASQGTFLVSSLSSTQSSGSVRALQEKLLNYCPIWYVKKNKNIEGPALSCVTEESSGSQKSQIKANVDNTGNCKENKNSPVKQLSAFDHLLNPDATCQRIKRVTFAANVEKAENDMPGTCKKVKLFKSSKGDKIKGNYTILKSVPVSEPNNVSKHQTGSLTMKSVQEEKSNHSSDTYLKSSSDTVQTSIVPEKENNVCSLKNAKSGSTSSTEVNLHVQEICQSESVVEKFTTNRNQNDNNLEEKSVRSGTNLDDGQNIKIVTASDTSGKLEKKTKNDTEVTKACVGSSDKIDTGTEKNSLAEKLDKTTKSSCDKITKPVDGEIKITTDKNQIYNLSEKLETETRSTRSRTRTLELVKNSNMADVLNKSLNLDRKTRNTYQTKSTGNGRNKIDTNMKHTVNSSYKLRTKTRNTHRNTKAPESNGGEKEDGDRNMVNPLEELGRKSTKSVESDSEGTVDGGHAMNSLQKLETKLNFTDSVKITKKGQEAHVNNSLERLGTNGKNNININANECCPNEPIVNSSEKLESRTKDKEYIEVNAESECEPNILKSNTTDTGHFSVTESALNIHVVNSLETLETETKGTGQSNKNEKSQNAQVINSLEKLKLGIKKPEYVMLIETCPSEYMENLSEKLETSDLRRPTGVKTGSSENLVKSSDKLQITASHCKATKQVNGSNCTSNLINTIYADWESSEECSETPDKIHSDEFKQKDPLVKNTNHCNNELTQANTEINSRVMGNSQLKPDIRSKTVHNYNITSVNRKLVKNVQPSSNTSNMKENQNSISFKKNSVNVKDNKNVSPFPVVKNPNIGTKSILKEIHTLGKGTNEQKITDIHSGNKDSELNTFSSSEKENTHNKIEGAKLSTKKLQHLDVLQNQLVETPTNSKEGTRISYSKRKLFCLTSDTKFIEMMDYEENSVTRCNPRKRTRKLTTTHIREETKTLSDCTPFNTSFSPSNLKTKNVQQCNDSKNKSKLCASLENVIMPYNDNPRAYRTYKEKNFPKKTSTRKETARTACKSSIYDDIDSENDHLWFSPLINKNRFINTKKKLPAKTNKRPKGKFFVSNCENREPTVDKLRCQPCEKGAPSKAQKSLVKSVAQTYFPEASTNNQEEEEELPPLIIETIPKKGLFTGCLISNNSGVKETVPILPLPVEPDVEASLVDKQKETSKLEQSVREINSKVTKVNTPHKPCSSQFTNKKIVSQVAINENVSDVIHTHSNNHTNEQSKEMHNQKKNLNHDRFNTVKLNRIGKDFGNLKNDSVSPSIHKYREDVLMKPNYPTSVDNNVLVIPNLSAVSNCTQNVGTQNTDINIREPKKHKYISSASVTRDDEFSPILNTVHNSMKMIKNTDHNDVHKSDVESVPSSDEELVEHVSKTKVTSNYVKDNSTKGVTANSTPSTSKNKTTSVRLAVKEKELQFFPNSPLALCHEPLQNSEDITSSPWLMAEDNGEEELCVVKQKGSTKKIHNYRSMSTSYQATVGQVPNQNAEALPSPSVPDIESLSDYEDIIMSQENKISSVKGNQGNEKIIIKAGENCKERIPKPDRARRSKHPKQNHELLWESLELSDLSSFSDLSSDNEDIAKQQLSEEVTSNTGLFEKDVPMIKDKGKERYSRKKKSNITQSQADVSYKGPRNTISNTSKKVVTIQEDEKMNTNNVSKNQKRVRQSKITKKKDEIKGRSRQADAKVSYQMSESSNNSLSSDEDLSKQSNECMTSKHVIEENKEELHFRTAENLIKGKQRHWNETSKHNGNGDKRLAKPLQMAKHNSKHKEDVVNSSIELLDLCSSSENSCDELQVRNHSKKITSTTVFELENQNLGSEVTKKDAIQNINKSGISNTSLLHSFRLELSDLSSSDEPISVDEEEYCNPVSGLVKQIQSDQKRVTNNNNKGNKELPISAQTVQWKTQSQNAGVIYPTLELSELSSDDDCINTQGNKEEVNSNAISNLVNSKQKSGKKIRPLQRIRNKVEKQRPHKTRYNLKFADVPTYKLNDLLSDDEQTSEPAFVIQESEKEVHSCLMSTSITKKQTIHKSYQEYSSDDDFSTGSPLSFQNTLRQFTEKKVQYLLNFSQNVTQVCDNLSSSFRNEHMNRQMLMKRFCGSVTSEMRLIESKQKEIKQYEEKLEEIARLVKLKHSCYQDIESSLFRVKEAHKTLTVNMRKTEERQKLNISSIKVQLQHLLEQQMVKERKDIVARCQATITSLYNKQR